MSKDKDEELPTGTIKLLTFDDIVNHFNNLHLKNLVAAWSDIIIFEGLKPDDVAAVERTVNAQGQTVNAKEIKVKDALKSQKKNYNKERQILAALEEVRVRFGNFNVKKEME